MYVNEVGTSSSRMQKLTRFYSAKKGAFHCAIRNPLAGEADELRESIEVRLAAFY